MSALDIHTESGKLRIALFRTFSPLIFGNLSEKRKGSKKGGKEGFIIIYQSKLTAIDMNAKFQSQKRLVVSLGLEEGGWNWHNSFQ